MITRSVWFRLCSLAKTFQISDLVRALKQKDFRAKCGPNMSSITHGVCQEFRAKRFFGKYLLYYQRNQLHTNTLVSEWSQIDIIPQTKEICHEKKKSFTSIAFRSSNFTTEIQSQKLLSCDYALLIYHIYLLSGRWRSLYILLSSSHRPEIN